MFKNAYKVPHNLYCKQHKNIKNINRQSSNKFHKKIFWYMNHL